MLWKTGLLAALIACVLTACGRTAEQNLEMLTCWNGSCEGTSSEEGYYWIEPRADGSLNVMAWNYDSGEKGVLCAEPGCGHGDASCCGWVGEYRSGVVALAWEDQLLLVFRGGEELARVEAADLAGGGRKQLAALEEGEELLPPFVGTDGGILCVCKRVQGAGVGRVNERALIYLDARTGEITQLFSASRQEMSIVGTAGPFVLLMRNDPGAQADLYAFDLRTNTMQLLETNCNADKRFFYTDLGYGSVDGQGKVSFCAAPDFERQEFTGLQIPLDAERGLESVYFEDAVDGNALFQVHMTGEEPSQTRVKRFGLFCEEQALRELNRSMEHEGVQEPAEIAAKLSQRLLVVEKIAWTEDESGQMRPEKQYALISKDDFWKE